MKAIVCHQFGDLSQVRLSEVPAPVAGEKQVIVRVRKASVSYMDWLMTQGRYQLKPALPYVPGTDISGVVVETGANVTRFKVGDRVAASTWHGGYSELVAIDEDICSLVPANVRDDQAASVIYAYGTAHYALAYRANLRDGEFLFVTGAAGGVGTAAVEIGALLGAKVIAGVGSLEKAATVRALGASEVILYREENVRKRISDITHGHGIDVCFETVGGELFEQIAKSMAWDGRLLPIGFASGEIPTIKANLPLIKNYSIVGAAAGPWWERSRQEAQASHAQLFEWLSEGLINPRIDRELPLEAAVEAMQLLGDRSVRGRIVLSVS